MLYAPVIIPTLCRSEHFIRCVESLKKNSWAQYTDIIVGLDYPLSEKHMNGWKKIMEYLSDNSFAEFNNFVVFKRDSNLGAGKNSYELRRYVQEHYDRYIYTDDDCEFSPNFLEYMDKCLDYFEDNPNIVAINGYSYPVKWITKDGSTCFIQDFNVATWGLGYWVKKIKPMEEYVKSGKMLRDAPIVITKEKYKKMIDSTFLEYFEGALRLFNKKSFMKKMTDCAMTAYLACANKYAISPIVSKVRNLGFDGSGIYCILTDGDGNSARNMNYAQQIIDTSRSFDIILNDETLLDKNRELMNKFDYISSDEMRCSVFNFQMIKKWGFYISVLIHILIVFPKHIFNLFKK